MSTDLARPPRDTFVDAVRAVATLCVVTVHWLMADATWDGRTLALGNALAHGHGWAATWVLQVLGLLFFAAGASAAYGTHRVPDAVRVRGHRLVARRLARLARPVGVFVGAWAVTLGVLHAVGLPDGALLALVRLAPQLLWFLGVYVVLVALTPLLRRALHAAGWWVVAGLTAVPLAVEALRFGAGLERLALVDVVLVWAVPYAIGVLYADARAGLRVVRRGRVVPVAALPSRPVLTGAGVAALAVAALLVAVGPYPASLVGMPGAAISNLGPPTAPALLHAVGLVVLALCAREVLVRWAEGTGRAVVGALAARSLTLYLWHVTAMVAVVAVVLVVLGTPLPVPGSADWWASRPLWFGAFALVLAGIVRLVGRAEGPAASAVPRVPRVHRVPRVRRRALSATGRAPSRAGGAASRPARPPAPAHAAR
ncbi:acyltransferase family protein [Cellulosimicrobium marinum]|uniref:acyltransferase family protein n=1 Tax=Cellulosimicrobium marinum TaxID=1638992 RepID=UPI001E3ABA67|nr:acyltransferase [Cellulosimicrobium marinum]MCB7137217.1 acyltransferase [Cellulosimicrobium marinum]